MGSPDGANPGRLVEYDANQHYVQAWPLDPPADGFDPHGLAIDEAHNLILTSDFICPAHTLAPDGDEVILLKLSDLPAATIAPATHNTSLVRTAIAEAKVSPVRRPVGLRVEASDSQRDVHQ